MIAAEQIKAQEKQRLIGILPNYYISFVHDAAPMTAKQKYGLALHEFLDPTRFAGTAIVAGVEQANNSYADYGSGAEGYGKRYAAAYGDGLLNVVISVVAPEKSIVPWACAKLVKAIAMKIGVIMRATGKKLHAGGCFTRSLRLG